MNTTHLYFDLETLAVKEPNTVILAVACVPFSFGERKSYDEYIAKGFYRKIQAKPQILAGDAKNADTIKWWQSQPIEAQKNAFLPRADDVTVQQAFLELSDWIITETDYDKRNSWIWSRGSSFDFPKIEYRFDQIASEIDCPINTWMIRDTRTMIDCLTGSKNGQYKLKQEPTNFVKHHCLHDCAHDVVIMKEIFDRLNEG